MAQMAVSEGGRFEFPYAITSALDNTNVGTLQTANKFLDKDIDIKLTLASAAATISASKTATSPTIARTDTSATGATNIGNSNATTTAPSSGYFIATQATAPATTLDITKTVNTPGYLGANTQINASASTTAKSGSIYYIPITTGVAAANASAASITIETTDDSSKAGINVQNILGTAADSEPTSGYFLRIKASGSGSSKVTTAGWFSTGALATSSTSTTKFYPVTAAGVTHTGGGISITTNYSGTPTVSAALTDQTTTGVALTTTEPSSGYYLTITSSSTALSGKTKATRAAYTETFTSGYLPAKSSTNILDSSAVEPTVTVNAGSGVSYLTIPSASVTTSSTNDGMSTYFTEGTSSDKNVTITPKYTNTAGYKAAVATATGNGGVTYWKIKTGAGGANTASAEIEKTTTDSSSVGGTNIGSILGTRATTEPTSGYYISLKATGSGSSKITTTGWMTSGTTLTAASTTAERFFPVTAAAGEITGTNTVTPSASLAGSNVTLSDTNNGISITATGGGTASVTAAAKINTAGYAPTTNSLFSKTLNAANNTTTATKYISEITIPSEKSLTITNNGTATMTTSGTANITSTGTTTVTSNSTTAGTVTIAAKTATGDSSNTSQVVVQNGLWKTTTASAASTYYGRVTVRSVSGSIGGSAASGSATAVITNTNSINTITDLTNKTAGTDYWQIKATATGTAGSYTPKYTVSTSGWLASTVNGTAQTVSVNGDSTGKSIYIPKATFSVSGSAVNVSTAGYIASGTVGTISNGTISTSTTDPGTGYTANTTAVVPSGGYLTMTAGYYPATKISLATLVPNGSNVAGHADYLLAGKTAYDNNGVLVTGNIATYQGDYTYTT